jgi:hypothetical protein
MDGTRVVEVIFVYLSADYGGHGGNIEALEEAADGDDGGDDVEVGEGFWLPHPHGV